MRWSGMVKWVLLVLLVMGAAVPSLAKADTFFIAGSYPATAHGTTSPSHAIGTEAGGITCETVHYHAEASAVSPGLPLTPSFTNCTAFSGFASATITTEGCTFDLRYPQETAEDSFKSTFDVSCPAGKSIKVSAGTCKLEVKAQSDLSSVAIANDTEATPKPDITFDPEVSNLAYTVTQDAFLCPLSGTGNKTDGSFTGAATTLTAQSPSNPETKIGLEVG